MADEQPEPEFDLARVAVREEGAFGVLLQDGLPFAVTLERTFEGLRVKIPAGRYVCRSSYFHRGGYDTYEVTGVRGHSRLLFHAGNTEDDSEGCILVGRRFGELSGRPAVLESRLGFDEFMRRAAGRPSFDLEVVEVSHV